MEQQFDLIVVGGGPAGSTASAFVALDGHRVLLLERERLPRYQIGESLLPSTVHGICAMLGIRDVIKQAGFTRKRGGTFRWGRNEEPWTFSFASSRGLTEDTSYAYQVERSRFDKILLDNARRLGVDVREEHTVTDVLFEGGRAVGVRFTDAAGREQLARATYVADASGNQTRLASAIGERVYSKFFRNVALFCYFENGRRLPPPNEGNILSCAFPSGWFWYIPLTPTLTSVGAVVAREEAGRLRDGHETAMKSFIAECPLIREYLAGATRVTDGQYGQFRVRKDYSYCHSRFWKPGAVLAGDAACFVDPVFSSGVHLATYSGLQAARAINTCLRGELDEERSFTEFELRYRREFSNFYQFLMAFYDMNQDETSYFWAARKVLNTEESTNEAFVRLVAGIGSSGEPLVGGPADFFRARVGIGDVLQRSTEGAADPASLGLDTAGPAVRDLLKNLKQEMVQVEMLGQHGGSRPIERPLFEGGLVPSRDGLRWSEPVETPLPVSTTPLGEAAARAER